MQPNYNKTLRACYLGYITQAVSINLAPLLFVIFRDRFFVSNEQLGRLILINFTTQIFVDALAAKYVDRIGYRPSVLGGLFMGVAGLISLSILPRALPDPYVGLTIATVLFASGSGLLEVLISPIVEAVPGDAKASAMSLLHSFYCWGQMVVVLLTTLFITAFGSEAWWMLPILWAVVPAIDFILFCRAPINTLHVEGGNTPVRKLLSSRFFLGAMFMMMAAGSAELAMSQWASLFAERGLGVPKLTGDILGMCLFAVCMGVVRTLYGKFGEKIELRRVLIWSSALAVACYGAAVFSLNPAISLAGCALCGVAVALMWPGTLSLSAKRFPMGGTVMFGVLAIAGDLGGALGPWMTGAVSDVTQRSASAMRLAASVGLQPDQLGLKAGLLVATIFPLGMLLALLLMKKRGNSGKGKHHVKKG
jgi:fucose permease